MKGVSVIVCCHNSQSRIRETLQHLEALRLQDTPFEIIIVDNNSSDDTLNVVSSIQSRSSLLQKVLRIVSQPEPGLANARKMGVAESSFDILIFCDDDNHLGENYVLDAVALLEAHPEVAIAGGWNKLKSDLKIPDWMDDFYTTFATSKLPPVEGYVNWVFGAGMIVRKDFLLELAEKQIGLLMSDRKGGNQTSGGDVEFCVLARFLGRKVYQSSTLTLYHKIESSRISKRSVLKLNKDNFKAMLELFMLENVIVSRENAVAPLLRRFVAERIKRIFTAPRLLFGRRGFLFLNEVYGNFQYILWVATNRREIEKSYNMIHANIFNKATLEKTPA